MSRLGDSVIQKVLPLFTSDLYPSYFHYYFLKIFIANFWLHEEPLSKPKHSNKGLKNIGEQWLG